MAVDELRHYMRQRTQEMQSEYERIQGRVREDPGTAGDNGEENWKELLEHWLPPLYKVVTKGRIMNHEGWCSPHMDVLVLSPQYPRGLLGKKEYLAGGVVAAFECKLTIRPEHVTEALKTAALLSSHCRTRRLNTPRRELHRGLFYGLLAHSHDWTQPKSTPLANLERGLLTADGTYASHPRDQIDLICVADLGCWLSSRMIFSRRMIAANPITNQLLDGVDTSTGIVMTSYVQHSTETQHKEADKGRVVPIGSMIVRLLEHLAWADEALRSVAEYFVLSDLVGSGRGAPRLWHAADVLSQQSLDGLDRPLSSDEVRWNEWGPLI